MMPSFYASDRRRRVGASADDEDDDAAASATKTPMRLAENDAEKHPLEPERRTTTAAAAVAAELTAEDDDGIVDDGIDVRSGEASSGTTGGTTVGNNGSGSSTEDGGGASVRRRETSGSRGRRNNKNNNNNKEATTNTVVTTATSSDENRYNGGGGDEEEEEEETTTTSTATVTPAPAGGGSSKQKGTKRALKDLLSDGGGGSGNKNSRGGSRYTGPSASASILFGAGGSSSYFSTTTTTGTTSTSATTTTTSPQPPPPWESYVRRGASLKAVLADAFQQARRHSRDAISAAAAAASRTRQMNEDGNGQGGHNENGQDDAEMNEADGEDDGDDGNRMYGANAYAVELAREKTAMVHLLQAQLKQEKAHVNALEASNESLRDQVTSSQTRLDRTVQALRLAGTNAAKARDDADAAEATAANLAVSFEALKTVVEETKRASLLLHREHGNVSDAANAAQQELLHKQEQLAYAQLETEKLKKSYAGLKGEAGSWKKERAALKEQISNKERLEEELKRKISGLEAECSARSERASSLVKEVQSARKLLLEATTQQKQAQATETSLKASLKEVQTANQDLHAKLATVAEQSRLEKKRLSDELYATQKKLQENRLESEAVLEKQQVLEDEKTRGEKQVVLLKRRVASLESRLEQITLSSLALSSPLHVPAVSGGTDIALDGLTASSVGNGTSSTKPFFLPPLQNGGATNNQNGNPSDSADSYCVICARKSFGLMKTCQCGKDCQKRVHVNCAHRIQPGYSVAHPGTPGPRLPLVLCGPVISTSAMPPLAEGTEAAGDDDNRN